MAGEQIRTVAGDVAEEKLSADGAFARYGVVIDPPEGLLEG